jgi:hypothetical protein
MTTVKSYGQIKGGKIFLYNQQRFVQDIADLKDCNIELTVRKKGNRSSQSNKYYWAVVVEEIRIRFKQLGHRLSAEEVHEFLKEKFNPIEIVNGETGELLGMTGGSTADMNQPEFSDYVDRIKAWASETLEIYIPDSINTDQSTF